MSLLCFSHGGAEDKNKLFVTSPFSRINTYSPIGLCGLFLTCGDNKIRRLIRQIQHYSFT
jgi:hypothetical protein